MLGLKSRLHKRKMQYKWRILNKHNSTIMGNVFNIDQVSVGRYTYGTMNVLTFNTNHNLLIGDFCSIASDVYFVLEADHYITNVSTFPFRVKFMNEEYEAISKGSINVGDDVWIGQGAVIMSGVKIGQGAIIAAGAVVVEDVLPYTIVGGVPATQIKHRFNENIVRYLLTLDYKGLTDELIKSHINDLYVPLNNLSLNRIKILYEWFPKKQLN